MSIYEKLLAIQQKLKVPKNQYNTFSNFYYRSCEDILESLKPLCNEQKTVLIICDEIAEIGGRIYVVASAKLHDIESSEFIECRGFAREDESQKGKDVAQITGSCSSYARKYALNGLFALDDAKDADAMPPAQQQAEKPAGSSQDPANSGRAEKPTAKATSKQLGQLQAMAKQKGVAIDSIVKGYQLAQLQDMTTAQWAQTMNSLRKRADAQ